MFVSRWSHRPRRVGVAIERKRKPHGDARSAVVHVVGLGVGRSSSEQGKARTLVRSLCRCRTALQRAKPSCEFPCKCGRGGWAHSRRGWGRGAAVPVPLRSGECKQCRSTPGSTPCSTPCSAHARRACPLRRSAASSLRGSGSPRRHLARPRRSAGRFAPLYLYVW